ISFVLPQIQLDRLRSTRKVIDGQDRLFAQLPYIRQYSVIDWIEKLNRSLAEYPSRSANCNYATHPGKKRMFASSLRQHVHCLITVNRIQDEWCIQALWICTRKASVPASAPLHRGPHSVAISQIDVVAHSDFVARIDYGSAGEGHQYPVHQRDASSIVVQQRRQPATESQINPHG